MIASALGEPTSEHIVFNMLLTITYIKSILDKNRKREYNKSR